MRQGCFRTGRRRARSQACAVEVIVRDGLTPVILADVPASPGAEAELVTLLYGHLDKQPPLGSWREGLDPFVAVREGDRLYGRGTADDGYAIFAALGALEALAASDTPHGRCFVLIESSEESGSSHLGPYLDEVAARAGAPGPGLVVCLDSGCATYDRLWITTSLRGSLIATIRVRGALRRDPQWQRGWRRSLLVPPATPIAVSCRGRKDRRDPRARAARRGARPLSER